MTDDITVSERVDATGQTCPMPVIEAKAGVDRLSSGQVLEVLATDKGSVSDIEGWAAATAGVELLDQAETEADGERVYTHYVKRTE